VKREIVEARPADGQVNKAETDTQVDESAPELTATRIKENQESTSLSSSPEAIVQEKSRKRRIRWLCMG